MMDEYEQWLLETIAWYEDWCRTDVADMGYPGQIRFASQDMRYSMEAYEESLEVYREFKRNGVVTPDG